MKLIISEKPSLAKSVAFAVGAKEHKNGYYIGNGYFVTNSIGHIYVMLKPDGINPKYKKWDLSDLPILPVKIPKVLKPEFEKQYKIIFDLAHRKDVDLIVNNGDSDAEGQLLIQEILDGIKNRKPVYRLWNSSLAAEDIRKAVKEMKPDSEYVNLLKSAEARSELDWLMGMNMSRLMSIKGNAVFPVGRVQTPVLNFICKRAEQVEHFKAIPYYVLSAKDNDVVLIWHSNDGDEKFAAKAEAEKTEQKIKGKTGTITNIKKCRKKVSKPNIYDTNTLQIDAEKMYGFSAVKTLDILEELYNKGITSYPRTDSSFLLEDMERDFDSFIDDIAEKNPKILPYIKKMKTMGYQNEYIFNDKKVEEHYGIIVTREYKKCNTEALTDEQRKILNLIVVRMLEVCAPNAEYDEIAIDAELEKELFSNKLTSMTRKGFLIFREKLLGKAKKVKKTLPEIKSGDTFTAKVTEVVEKIPKKPHYYTESELISLMKNVAREAPEKYRKALRDAEGLGTAATRASIIKGLIDTHYVDKKGRGLIPTEKGRYLISVIDDELKSPALTAQMETQLNLIRKGKCDKVKFIANTKKQLTNLINKGKSAPIAPFSKLRTSKPVLGKCPRCGKDVIEGPKSFYCLGRKDKSCDFYIWKENKLLLSQKKKLTASMVKTLLAKGRVHVKGLTSKKNGKKYDADIVLSDTGKRVDFKMEFASKV